MHDRTHPHLRVAVVIPNKMAARGVLDTRIARELRSRNDMSLAVLTPNEHDLKELVKGTLPGAYWYDVYQPDGETPVTHSNTSEPARAEIAGWLRNLLFHSGTWPIRWMLGFDRLAFRFNHLNQFSTHSWKVKLSPHEKKREAVAGNFLDEKLGRPFKNSRWLYERLYKIYYSLWQYEGSQTRQFFRSFRPDVIVLVYVQKPIMKSYILGAKHHNAKILGIIGSTDKLTTKGPVPRHIDRYLAYGERMARELVDYHHVSRSRVCNVGWPQLDHAIKKENKKSVEWFKQYGIDESWTVILFAGNSERLGAHEPAISREVANAVTRKRFGNNVMLIVRPHPNDQHWRDRFADLHNPPQVQVQQAEWGNLAGLNDTLQHSAVVIASQGSITLDAIAVDKPVVNIAFDHGVKRSESWEVKRFYEMDHYKDVVRDGAARIVYSMDEMLLAIETYLKNPSIDKPARKKTRDRILEPLDGQSSRRLVEEIAIEGASDPEPKDTRKGIPLRADAVG